MHDILKLLLIRSTVGQFLVSCCCKITSSLHFFSVTTTYCWCSVWYQNNLAIWVKMSFEKLSKMINALHCPVLQLTPFFSSSILCTALLFCGNCAFCKGGAHASGDFWILKSWDFPFSLKKKWRESVLYVWKPVKTVHYLV